MKGSDPVQLSPIPAKDFDAAFALLEQSFPPCERRSRTAARALLSNPAYTLYGIEKSGKQVGVLSLWRLCGLIFIEHFVISPAHRNQGLGLDTLRLLQADGTPLLLECECPDTPVAARRLAFYARAGFYENPVAYAQPPYRKGEHSVPMRLLSWPCALSDPAATVAELFHTVYGIS
jgi:GNAT superfamily N-acetyltransferase